MFLLFNLLAGPAAGAPKDLPLADTMVGKRIKTPTEVSVTFFSLRDESAARARRDPGVVDESYV
jgi:hypothetical protein